MDLKLEAFVFRTLKYLTSLDSIQCLQIISLFLKQNY